MPSSNPEMLNQSRSDFICLNELMVPERLRPPSQEKRRHKGYQNCRDGYHQSVSLRGLLLYARDVPECLADRVEITQSHP